MYLCLFIQRVTQLKDDTEEEKEESDPECTDDYDDEGYSAFGEGGVKDEDSEVSDSEGEEEEEENE